MKSEDEMDKIDLKAFVSELKKVVLLLGATFLFPVLIFCYLIFFLSITEPISPEADGSIIFYLPRIVVLVNFVLPFTIITYPHKTFNKRKFVKWYGLYTLIALIIGLVLSILVKGMFENASW